MALFVATPALAEADPGDLAAYLKARAADADGDAGAAVTSYAVALDAAPNNAVIALRAYRAALDAGDTALVDRSLAVLTKAGAAPTDSAITALAAAVRSGDMRAADAAIDRLDGTPIAFLAPVLRAWQAYDRGDKDAVARLNVGGNAIGRRYYAENRALLLIATGQTQDGVTAAQALLAPDQGSFDFPHRRRATARGQGRNREGQDPARRRRSGADGLPRTSRRRRQARAGVRARRICSTGSRPTCRKTIPARWGWC